MVFSVIGGDVRQVRLAELLAGDGHGVKVFGFDNAEFKKAEPAESLAEALEHAACVILPVPALTQDRCINAPLCADKIYAGDVFRYIGTGTVVCAGKADKNLTDIAGDKASAVIDYMCKEEFAVANAAITAEGAVGLLIQELETTAAGCEILIIGYGRIGKQLAAKLRGLNGKVTVSARNPGDMALIEANGYKSADTNSLGNGLGKFDVIINTVPAPVLTKERLRLLSESCFCLDLASKPGGIDMSAASALGLHALSAPGLPGKTAPVSAAKAIRDTIYNIMYEKGKRT